MNIDTQSVDQAVTAMAEVLADYLHPEEVRLLKSQWQRYSTVSVKMMQQCVLDATRRYPELQAYKSDIRKGFWATLQADSQQTVEVNSHNSHNGHNKAIKAPVPTAIASAPNAKAFAISAPSLIPPAKTSDTSPVFPTSSSALLASLTAAIPGIPVFAAAI